MDCATLPSFLADDLSREQQGQFEQHLVECPGCQREVEAAMQVHALGVLLSQRSERPHAAASPQPFASPARPDALAHSPSLPDVRRQRRRWLAAAALSIAAAVVFWLLPIGDRGQLDRDLVADLRHDRTTMERLPFEPLDRYRPYDTTRGAAAIGATRGAPVGDNISRKALAVLEDRPDRSGLVAALLARGEVEAAANELAHAGPGDALDVERAIVAAHDARYTDALTILDNVLRRSPGHRQAMWNRAVVLGELDLPNVAAEAFAASAELAERGWTTEAAERRDALRTQESERTERLKAAVARCNQLRDGVLPDVEFVRRNASLCRPALHVAVRRATTRADVMRLLPIARAIDDASGDTGSSELVERVAATDFQQRAAAAAVYRTLNTRRDTSPDERAQLMAQLRAARQPDLVIGVLIHGQPLSPDEVNELARLAHDSHDPYVEELAIEQRARAQVDARRPLEAEAILREATRQCAQRKVELRCMYLHLMLVDLYLARHLPTEARETAFVALQRARELGLSWPERLLFDQIAKAARFERDYSQMRAYAREGALRDSECLQLQWSGELSSEVELAELRFASARAELGQTPTCQRPLTLERAEMEAELARDATPAQLAALQAAYARMRTERTLTPGERAQLDAIEGRLLARRDPVAARTLLARAIQAADALGIDDVMATKARRYAYRTLLLLGASDLDGPALLALFAAAGRVQLHGGCALGAMIDGEQLVLLARGANGFKKRFEPHAFKTPDFDARTLVPADLVDALTGCARVDVLALPPLYGQPRLLPANLAWSYRGPAGAPPARPRQPVVLTVEDTRPPPALKLPRLSPPPPVRRAIPVDDVVLSGDVATPGRVARELAVSDLVELHAHGFVDLGISDVSLVALSPDADGNFALTARTIAALKLSRAPFVTLATCRSAYTAPYLHEPWSLPYAFLLAGARGVLAPATDIPDREAGEFFRVVGDQILRGLDPAVVLRDQRAQRRGSSSDWINSVVLFD